MGKISKYLKNREILIQILIYICEEIKSQFDE